MSSALRSPKTLANWIELDYHRRRRLFGPWWRRLLLVALAASALALAGMAFALGHRSFQAGPVSAPHAMFNSDCRLCHDGDFSTLTRLWGGAGVSVPDAKCLACHAGSHHNPPHAAMGRCVDCHKEHRGHAALVRVDDRQCVRCHQDLERDDGSPSPFAPSVTAFTGSGHPPFRYFRTNEAKFPDPGTLKFNHAVHLADRGVLELDPNQRPGLPRELTFTHLACDDCHQPDASGRLMRPISYDRHCARCHPIGAPIVGDFKDAERRSLARDFAARRIAHPRPGQGPDVVRASLRDQLTRFINGPQGGLFLTPTPDVPDRPLPGRPPPAVGVTAAEKAFAWVNRNLQETDRIVFFGAGGCRYCHAVTSDAAGAPLVAPPAIKDRWWDHAAFDHGPHRLLTCTECHPARTSRLTSDVLLPSRDLCLKCHTTGARASARGDCVECHVYHDPSAQKAARAKGGALTLEGLNR